jgi:DnaJ-domain-containing protein 1
MSEQLAFLPKENRCAIEVDDQGVSVKSPFNAAFLNDFKQAIPPAARAWNKPTKRWFVDALYAPVVAQLIKQHYGEDVEVPQAAVVSKVEQLILRVEYVGLCKLRDDGSVSAYGYSDGDWSVVFPEELLRSYFGSQPKEEAAPSTYYQLLGIKKNAKPVDIKSAYRRMARQWHPDVCHEPDAADRFRQINDAYNLLSDPLRKRKYDAGLAFEASLKIDRRQNDDILQMHEPYFRAPLRSGNITVKAHKHLGRIIVDEILAWDDITDMFGRVMVVSWPRGADTFKVQWTDGGI